MMKVSNKKTINKLASRSFMDNKSRNIVAVIAIMLTSILFTALFTAAVTMEYTSEQQSFRMIGGDAHASVKDLSLEQVENLITHPLIKEYGTTLILAVAENEELSKEQVEMRYADAKAAEHFFSAPTTGRMPKDDSMEVATATLVLDLLGIPHKVGEEVTLTYTLGETMVTDTFTLVGFWESDEVSLASQVWLPKDYVVGKVEELQEYIAIKGEGSAPSYLGKWNLDIMFSSSKNIEENVIQVIEDSGYTALEVNDENSLGYGVNSGYIDAKSDSSSGNTTTFAVLGIGIFIIFIGYLIIYNVFQISFVKDINFFGLLKTLGTTAKQIRSILLKQVFILAAVGIPLGLASGYVVGMKIVELIHSNNTSTATYSTFDPRIVLGASIFSLVTILISFRKPAKVVSAVSPLEAIRFTEQSFSNKRVKTARKTKKGSRIWQMAMENAKRNKKKTILVILSLTFSLVLLCATYMIINGFDMNKYISKFVTNDYTIGSAAYFNFKLYNNGALDSNFIEAVEGQEGIIDGEAIYIDFTDAKVMVTEEDFRILHQDMPEDYLLGMLENKDESGRVMDTTNIYGMEEFALSKFEVIEGSIDKEKLKTGDYIIQILYTDDFDNVNTEFQVYGVGDMVCIDYLLDYDIDEEGIYTVYSIKEKEYEVMATVKHINSMSTFYSSSGAEYILWSDVLIEDSGSATPMIYVYDMEEEYMDEMDVFLENYTTNVDITMDYASKTTYTSSFANLQFTFFAVGIILSIILGLIGIINFINVEVTSISTRRREFAVMQSIGMTNRQLTKMLIIEGVLYSGIGVVVALGISILVGEVFIDSLLASLWFFTYELNIVPILIVGPLFILAGIIIPILAYRSSNKQSIVERLRDE